MITGEFHTCGDKATENNKHGGSFSVQGLLTVATFQWNSHWILQSYKIHLKKVLRRTLFQEWSGIGIGCPARWLSHHPWRCLKNV